MSDIFAWLRWLLVLSAVGWLAYPLAFRLFAHLPGRGVAFIRPLGLLLWGFLFWLPGSLGLLGNDLGGSWLALAALAGLGLWARRGDPGAGWRWLRDNRGSALAVEIVFLLAFALLSLLRALYPDVTFTEKPMELAFINAILRSPSLPPLDPWLADYAISYYYFGYLLTAMLARLAAAPVGMAFNLMVASVFAMTAAAVYGLVADLLARRGESPGRAHGLALLAPLFTLVVSNLGGLLEFLHARGAFWRYQGGELVSRFWAWLDVKDLVNPPVLMAGELNLRHWWWWRASRVITDRNFAGTEFEVIDEFPFFSYYLADLHPHVLSMPFVILMLALMLNYFLGGGRGKTRLGGWFLPLSPPMVLFSGLLLGGLAFLNIWDFPIYFGLFVLVFTYVQAQEKGLAWGRLGEGLSAGAVVAVLGWLLYLPFHLGFSSQAGGALPNLITPTRGAQLWVMFGPLFVPLFLFLLWVYRGRGLRPVATALAAGLALVLGLWLASLGLALLINFGLPALARDPAAANLLAGLNGAPDFGALLQTGLARRLAAPGGWLTLAVLAGLAGYWLWPRPAEHKKPAHAADVFAILLILFGGLLVLAPEFIYLRDQFGHRMNTVFKFFIQAWLVWGVAAGYAAAVLLSAPRRGGRLAFGGLLVAVLAAGLVYPQMGIAEKAQQWRNSGRPLTLDGTSHTAYLNEDDKAAVAWLTRQQPATLVEAVGGSYSQYARISAHSGQPALLGWPGHESQWRGGGAEMGNRQADIERLYTTASWPEAFALLRFYNIRYIYVGTLERSTYAVDEAKFALFLPVGFQQGSATIYFVPEGLLAAD